MPFEAKIADFIARHQLLEPGRRYLVALSGGADSVCLLLLLRRMGYTVEAAHCNFHLRGDESDRDERFCEALCRREDIPLHRAHFDTQTYATLHHVSMEMAARELRYNYFSQILQSIGTETVCVAHHQDDNTETVLINLVRGTGIHGLTGMAPMAPLPVKTGGASGLKQGAAELTAAVSELKVVRPLLCVNREEVLKYLDSIGQDYVTDSTNLQADVLRNKIRLRLMPLLQDISPSASAAIALTAERMTAAAELFDEAVRQQTVAAVVEKNDRFIAFSTARLLRNEYLLFEALHPYGFASAQCSQMFLSLGRSEGAREWESGTHVTVSDRDRLLVYRRDDPRLATRLTPRTLPLVARYDLGPIGHYDLSVVERTNGGFTIDKSPLVACLDADKTAFPLTLRPTRSGDRFWPFGMKGTKLVSDYLTDRRRSLYEKRCQLVLTDAEDRILWLVGERTSQLAAVTSDTRRMLLVVSLPTSSL